MTAVRAGARARGAVPGAARGAGSLLVAVLSAVVLVPVGTSAAQAQSGSAAAPQTSTAATGPPVTPIAGAEGQGPSLPSGRAAQAASPTTAPEPLSPARGLPGAPSSRDLGLAVLLAVVLLAGVASLLVRVLLAEPLPGTAPDGAGRPVPAPDLSDPPARL